jgi:hypothetical protein
VTPTILYIQKPKLIPKNNQIPSRRCGEKWSSGTRRRQSKCLPSVVKPSSLPNAMQRSTSKHHETMRLSSTYSSRSAARMSREIPNRSISHSDQRNTGSGCASVLNTQWSSGRRSSSVNNKNRYLSLGDYVVRQYSLYARVEPDSTQGTYVSARNQL